MVVVVGGWWRGRVVAVTLGVLCDGSRGAVEEDEVVVVVVVGMGVFQKASGNVMLQWRIECVRVAFQPA